MSTFQSNFVTPPGEPIIVADFTVVIDQREQAPFGFRNIRASAANGNAPIAVPTDTTLLATGDYSIAGLEAFVTVERKSVSDLVGTLTAGRERFEDELERASKMECAWVVVEGGWPEIMQRIAERKVAAKSITGSMIAWQMRYPTIHWWTCADRRMAEVITFRLLERFWVERLRKVREAMQASGCGFD